MKRIVFFLLLCIVVIGTGCPKTTPKQPAVFNRVVNYQLQQLDHNIATYECSMVPQTLVITAAGAVMTACPAGSVIDAVKARRIRDSTMHNLIRLVDSQYFEFENDIYVGRSSGSVLADIIDDSANFAATITNGERAKTIINAALIAFRSGRKSASIHFFREQTGEILITNMQTSRNRVLADMLLNIRDKDAFDYSLEEGLGDVIKYFYAGTLPRALQELQRNTSSAAQTATQNVTAAQQPIRQLVTQNERDAGKEILDTLTLIEKSVRPPAVVSANLTSRLQRIYFTLNNSKKFNTLIDQIKTETQTPAQEAAAALAAGVAALDCTLPANLADDICVVDRLKQNQFDAVTTYLVILLVSKKTEGLELNREFLDIIKNTK